MPTRMDPASIQDYRISGSHRENFTNMLFMDQMHSESRGGRQGRQCRAGDSYRGRENSYTLARARSRMSSDAIGNVQGWGATRSAAPPWGRPWLRDALGCNRPAPLRL
jgi:hypothetical protein